MNETLVSRIEQHVTELFAAKTPTSLSYHTLLHTQEVVRTTERLAEHYQLSGTDYLTVLVAAWFHDVGYLVTTPAQHEAKGAELAVTFLVENDVSSAVITKVQQCIMATKSPQIPHDLLEQILCDADLFHLGSENFREKTKLLRQEQEQLSGQSISGSDWRLKNIALLRSHRYFTDYAQTLQQKGQADNLRRLLEKQAEKNQPVSEPAPPVDKPIPETNSDERQKKAKDTKYGRGVETMFRTTSTNHVRLSEMADNKANTMITVNSILISVLISVLFRQLEEHKELLVPVGMILSTSLLTIIFSVLVTRPSVNQGTFSTEDVRQRKVNLLFFGNFYKMKLEDYEQGVSTLLRDQDYLYDSLTRDLYYMGVVLGRKYERLRIAYNVFLFGFVASVISFIIVSMLNK